MAPVRAEFMAQAVVYFLTEKSPCNLAYVDRSAIKVGDTILGHLSKSSSQESRSLVQLLVENMYSLEKCEGRDISPSAIQRPLANQRSNKFPINLSPSEGTSAAVSFAYTRRHWLLLAACGA